MKPTTMSPMLIDSLYGAALAIQASEQVRIRCLELAIEACRDSVHDPVAMAERMEQFVTGSEPARTKEVSK